MTDPVYIEKIQPDPDGLDFEGLKRKGIALLQDLSGKSWTDYNLHDPGVTILEVLCYALTELGYRTDFDVSDFLTGQGGSINFENQALFQPQDIFPSQAVTINDYRKLIYDSIPEIDNVWITPVQSSITDRQSKNLRGLYCISVILSETVHGPVESTRNEPERERIKDLVRHLYVANRNICEDLIQVNVIEPDYYPLQGTVEIEGHRNPDDILAEIYFKTAKYLCPSLSIQDYDVEPRHGKSLEDIFTGPLTEHGYISDDDLDRRVEYAQISDLNGILGEIEGVRYVDALWFEDGLSFIEYDRTLQSMPCLLFPATKEEIGIRLEKTGRLHSVNLSRVASEFDRLKFEDQALRRVRQDIANFSDPPRGEFRNFSEYYSIQNHFPQTYGIGKQGLPGGRWASPEQAGEALHVRQLSQQKADAARRAARTRQLKAYLVLFEQIMANYLANLQGLSRLFSVDDQLDRSYFHQVLDEKTVPGINEIYHEETSRVDDRVAMLQGHYDNYGDRRNRILDYLLAIYGERFTQNSLRRFRGPLSEHEFGYEMILNKIKLLREIRSLSRQRAGAFNYLEKSWETENAATMNKKVNILLGLRNFKSRSLSPESDTMDSEGCHMLEHILLRPVSGQSHGIEIPDDFYSFKVSILFPSWTRRFSDSEFRKLAEETVRLNCPAHVSPVFHWLGRERMPRFESLYKNWLEIKRDPDASNGKRDEASRDLIKFLLDSQEPESDKNKSPDHR
jgi:hypothetical protein